MYAPNITREYNLPDDSDDNEAWVDAITSVYDELNISAPLHVWENGFVQGDASDKEIKKLIKKLKVADADALFEKLNASLEHFYRTELAKLETPELDEEDDSDDFDRVGENTAPMPYRN